MDSRATRVVEVALTLLRSEAIGGTRRSFPDRVRGAGELYQTRVKSVSVTNDWLVGCDHRGDHHGRAPGSRWRETNVFGRATKSGIQKFMYKTGGCREWGYAGDVVCSGRIRQDRTGSTCSAAGAAGRPLEGAT